MKKQIFIFLILLLIPAMLIGQAKDPFDSFDNFASIKVGIVVAKDTTLAPTDSYGSMWYNYFKSLHFNVKKIDTSYCAGATYNGVNNWNTLDFVVFIPTSDYNNIVTIDTSVANGIGEVSLINMHYSSTLANSLGFANSLEYAIIDSFRFGSDTTAFPINYCTPHGITTTIYTPTIYGIADEDTAAYPTNNLVFGIANGVDTIAVAVYDTLNSQHRLFFAGGNIWPYEYLDYCNVERAHGFQPHDPLAALNRTISIMIGTNTDSLFYFAGYGGREGTTGAAQIDIIRNWLECNGHRTDVADVKAINDNGGDYGDSTTYNGISAWSAPNALFFGGEGASSIAGSKANIDSYIKKAVAIGRLSAAYMGGISARGTGSSADTLTSTNTNHSILTGGSGLNDTLVITSSATTQYAYLESNSNHTLIYSLLVSGITKPNVVVENGTQKVGITFTGGNTGFDNMLHPQNWSSDFWDLLGNSFGWVLYSNLSNPPTSFTLTTLNTDSVGASWTDNEANETSYGIYIYEPTGFWFTTALAASTETDTLFPFWPPNSMIIADVAAIKGADNDTLFSGIPDTAYTLASAPVPPTFEVSSDSSMKFTINGYEFFDGFKDTTVLRHEVFPWVQTVGTWDNDYPNRYMEIETSTGGDIAIQYTSSNLSKDVEYRVSYAFSDSTLFPSQNIKWHIFASDFNFDQNGYYVYVEYDSIFLKVMTAGTSTSLISASVFGENSHWHNLKLTRDWDETPADTTITWTLYWDGLSKGTSTNATYLTSSYMGIETSHSGQHIDNFFIRGLTPSANHSGTLYAVQDSISTNYIDLTLHPPRLTAAAVWATYAEWDSLQGDTIVGLTPYTTYAWRVKAKSGR